MRAEDIIGRLLAAIGLFVLGFGALVCLTSEPRVWVGAAVTAWVGAGFILLGYIIVQLKIEPR